MIDKHSPTLTLVPRQLKHIQARDEQTRKRAEMIVAGAAAAAATKQCGENNNKLIVAVGWCFHLGWCTKNRTTTDGVGGTTAAPAALGVTAGSNTTSNKNDDGTVREGWDARTG
jgi:hypothetical protein